MSTKVPPAPQPTGFLRRLQAPYLLFPSDLEEILGVDVGAVEPLLLAGCCWLPILVAGEPCVMRRDFEGQVRLLASQRNLADRELLEARHGSGVMEDDR